MLTLTDNASTIVKDLATQSAAADQAGLRISTSEDDAGAFAVSIAPSPEAEDQVVESSGARVFLEPVAAQTLADKVLDAQVDTEGRLRFSLGDQ